LHKKNKSKIYNDLTPLLAGNYDYEINTELYKIRKDKKISKFVDLNSRIRYYLFSYLTVKDREKKPATFDELVLYIMPLLKNGTTPENQTILNVLEKVAEPFGENGWKLRKSNQLTMNFNQ